MFFVVIFSVAEVGLIYFLTDFVFMNLLSLLFFFVILSAVAKRHVSPAVMEDVMANVRDSDDKSEVMKKVRKGK